MKLKSKILLGFAVFVIILATVLIQKQLKEVKVIRGGIAIKEEFTEPVDTTMLVDEDSIFHSRICSDYGVAWKSYDLKKKKNKIILFDSYSGELLIYYFDKSQKISKLGIEPADQSFSWDFSNNKLSGMYGRIKKDTTFYWTINEKKQQLIDENGMVFEKIKIPVNKRE
jgi:hypothetical protein